MRLIVFLIKLDETHNPELLNDAVPAIWRHGRDERQYFLRTREISTPLGMPLSFVVDLSEKSQHLTVTSVNCVLLHVEAFDLFNSAQLWLSTDETIRIELGHDQESDSLAFRRRRGLG